MLGKSIWLILEKYIATQDMQEVLSVFQESQFWANSYLPSKLWQKKLHWNLINDLNLINGYNSITTNVYYI